MSHSNSHRNEKIQLGDTENDWNSLYAKLDKKRLVSGESLLYSSHGEENVSHTKVLLTLPKEERNALIRWETYGSMIETSFKTKKENIAINLSNATHLSVMGVRTIKTKFMRLQSILQKYQQQELTTLVGDLNP